MLDREKIEDISGRETIGPEISLSEVEERPKKHQPKTTAAEILQEVGASSPRSLRQLSATQEAGMKLAWAVGIAIAVVIVFVCVDWLLTIPYGRPSITASRDAIDNYKEMRASAVEDASKLFDLVVAKALLPVFTAILGYIFGSRETFPSREEEN